MSAPAGRPPGIVVALASDLVLVSVPDALMARDLADYVDSLGPVLRERVRVLALAGDYLFYDLREAPPAVVEAARRVEEFWATRLRAREEDGGVPS